MSRSIRFFYFGYQCPHNTYLLARIKTIAWREGAALHLHDITYDEEICAEYGLFTPTTLVVNEEVRFNGPFAKDQVIALLEGEDVIEPPSAVDSGDTLVRGDLVPLTPTSVLSTCAPCLGSEDVGICRGKAEWIGSMLERTNEEHLGYLHFVDGRCVGGAEYLPSKQVPYPIPGKGDSIAFITCSFASDAEKDFRSHPLSALSRHLKATGYDSLTMVASSGTAFPNGTAAWFIERGFEDGGILRVDERTGDELHLLKKPL